MELGGTWHFARYLDFPSCGKCCFLCTIMHYLLWRQLYFLPIFVRQSELIVLLIIFWYQIEILYLYFILVVFNCRSGLLELLFWMKMLSYGVFVMEFDQYEECVICSNYVKVEGSCWGFFLSVFFFLLAFLQPVNRSGGNALFPAEGKNGTASLFALIVQAELKGNSDILLCSSCCTGSTTIFPAFLFNYQDIMVNVLWYSCFCISI